MNQLLQLPAPMTEDDAIIAQALAILERAVRRETFRASSPSAVKQYLTLQMGRLEYEVFCVMWFDVKNRLIEIEELFRGTLTHCPVYTREILRSAIRTNAASALISHCHPSGECEPSDSDRHLTKSLRDTLSMVDVRLLDHIIVAGITTYSFAEHGLL